MHTREFLFADLIEAYRLTRDEGCGKIIESYQMKGGLLMKFTFSPDAIKALEKRQATENISLYYYTDTDFCACAASGIFALRVNDTSEDVYDTSIQTNLGEIKVMKESLVYLDQDNQIDFKANMNAFILKSERGYLNMNVRLEISEAVQ